jgi:hypothetical protein
MNVSRDDFSFIDCLDLEPIKFRLMHKGWSQERANSAEREYRRFLYLMKKYPNELTAPSVEVDKFCHQHILDTRKYANDCQAVFGYFLHHYPYLGLGGEEDAALHASAGRRMHELYGHTFGPDESAAMTAPATGYATANKPEPSAAAYCTRALPEPSTTAYCTRALPKASATAYCTRAMPKASATAYCTRVFPAASATAYCTRALPEASATAYCTRALPEASATAYCTRALPEASATAYCTRALSDASATAFDTSGYTATGTARANRSLHLVISAN